MRLRYGSGGMFMMDMHGTRERGDGGQQLAHAGRAVLRLLHGQADQVEVSGIHVARARGGDPAGQLARIDLDLLRAASNGHAHAKALAVDQVRFGRQAHELHLVPREQQLGCEQGAVGGAQDQDLALDGHGCLLLVEGPVLLAQRSGYASAHALAKSKRF